MSTQDFTPRTITPAMRREMLAAWDEARLIVDSPALWITCPAQTRNWFKLTFMAYGMALNGPLNVASGC